MTPSSHLELKALKNRNYLLCKLGLRLMAAVYAHRDQEPTEWLKIDLLLRRFRMLHTVLPTLQTWAARAEIASLYSPTTGEWSNTEAPQLPPHQRLIDYTHQHRDRFWRDYAEYIDADPGKVWLGRWPDGSGEVDWYRAPLVATLAGWGVRPMEMLRSLTDSGRLDAKRQKNGKRRFQRQIRLDGGEREWVYRIKMA